MQLSRILTVLLCLTAAIASVAHDLPKARVMVGYNYHEVFVRGSDGVVERDIPFVLLVGDSESKFFCRSTEHKDSLQSTPEGRSISKQLMNDAVKRYLETKNSEAMEAVTYRTQLYVYKSSGQCTVYDNAGIPGYYTYTEPLESIDWAVSSDSTRTILGYECIMATARYHGREWTAWFAPELPISDGPWKLHGLPGLILEAGESQGHHHFTAQGIESVDRPIRPVYSPERYESTSRIEMLRLMHSSRVNGSAMARALIGIDLGTNTPPRDAYDIYDLLETDYK